MNSGQRPDHLNILESEAVFILREAASQFARAALLFSGGKDSIVLFHIARKAFLPLAQPFTLLHIDTGHNFSETLAFRDALVNNYKAQLIVGYVQDSINAGTVTDVIGGRNRLQSVTLLEMVRAHRFDALIGGARRDEEKARAKERFFSRRDEQGSWNPYLQQPEPWLILNGHQREGEHCRVFPLNNWTELDIWLYIRREKIEVPSLYFAHWRDVVKHGETLLAFVDPVSKFANKTPEKKKVRFRTIGDMTCTGAVESDAETVDAIIEETIQFKTSERGTRVDDAFSVTAMEDRKKEGYF